MNNLPREQWQALLNGVCKQELADVITEISASWQITPLVVPQAGLAMLKMTESVFHDNYNLGEFPISQVRLRITTQQGNAVEGAALVMDEDLVHAQNLAVCDAVLAAKLPGWHALSSLLEKGQRQRNATACERKSYLYHTKVNFSRLEEAGDVSA